MKKETRRQRKKRLWMLRQERMRNAGGGDRMRDEDSRWAYLPDLVLEAIFQMLPYEVG